jgi:hypothetical protein
MPKITTFLYGDLALVPQVAEVPIVETLAFYTDQQLAYDGSEQNIQIRSMPRQSFAFKIPLQGDNQADAFNTAYGAIRRLWAIPNWCDAQYIGLVDEGAVLINCDTVNHDLRPQSLAMIFDGCGQWQIAEINAVGESAITLILPLHRMRGAMLIPVRVGIAISNITKPTNGYKGGINFNFQVADNAAYEPAAPDQYLANDIYYKPGLLDGDTTDTAFQMRQDINDFDIGVFEARTPWNWAKFSRTYRNISVTPEERQEFRNFIYRRAGKARPFWMPTFQNDVRITNTGTIVSALTANRDSYIDYGVQRSHVAIEAGGVWFPREITSVTPEAGDTMTLNLSSPVNVAADTVTRVSYLGLNRLDADSIEFNYTGPKVCEVAVSIIELQP